MPFMLPPFPFSLPFSHTLPPFPHPSPSCFSLPFFALSADAPLSCLSQCVLDVRAIIVHSLPCPFTPAQYPLSLFYIQIASINNIVI